MEKDTSFRIGENVKIVASNRPWVDLSVPPESNDFRDVDYSNIQIIDPCGAIIVDYSMCRMPNKIGWYYYDFQTTTEHKAGLWRAVLKFSCDDLTACSQPTTSTATSSTSGAASNTVSSIAVKYFRLLNDRMF